MMNASFEGTKRLNFTAPAGGVKSGVGLLIEGVFGIPIADQVEGKLFTLNREVVVNVKVEAKGGQIKQGAKIYWKAGRANAEYHSDKTDVGSLFVGYANKPKGHAYAKADGILLANNAVGVISVAIDPTHADKIA